MEPEAAEDANGQFAPRITPPLASGARRLPMREAAMTAMATTVMKMVHTALISGFTPSRTSE